MMAKKAEEEIVETQNIVENARKAQRRMGRKSNGRKQVKRGKHKESKKDRESQMERKTQGKNRRADISLYCCSTT